MRSNTKFDYQGRLWDGLPIHLKKSLSFSEFVELLEWIENQGSDPKVNLDKPFHKFTVMEM